MLNPESNLKFYWVAKFKNGEELSQFDSSGVEILFKEVLDRSNDLVSFSLHHTDLPLKITVDLLRGILFYNTEPQDLGDEFNEEKYNIRLIFFRRHIIQGIEGTSTVKHSILYFVGYQYNNKMGINKKVLVQLDEQGNMILGG